jgi:DNA-binding transcriptional ArsR family regulator
VQLLRTGPNNVGQIGEKLGYEQSRVSHNLGCLLNCGFVLSEWQGKNKIYRLNPDMFQILTGIEKHLAGYAPALDSCRVLGTESRPVVVVRSARVRRAQRPRRTVKKG